MLPAWYAVFVVSVVLTVCAVHRLPLLVGGADPGQVHIAVLVSLALVRRALTPHHRRPVLHPLSHLNTAQSVSITELLGPALLYRHDPPIVPGVVNTQIAVSVGD